MTNEVRIFESGALNGKGKNLKQILIVTSMFLVLLLSGCGRGSKQDVMTKAKSITTKQELEKAFGKADSFSSLGPIEMWTYKVSDGEVVFVVTGDKVALKASGGDGK